ncbi:uncharacterized protein LACBIDRAFT_314935 [Laccaria bicolor S238N-H82]|uniref:Predicted protein n=1 Tax=Laccaria bicolor (strain S238N-H82 / ATCC MYA-4686) TaxID=486041 RepID=B0DZH8_LACBS|nr:uncharacterized protein LACBIDRAFT_314935 [Laccaria bicolor S238N-H82]EDR00023.1 predicted protein [Laccaria bicolor S238N-H82]|eukprot:XP_001889332.1 predicted protein [Laccaria bicolor S238N-H82]
MYFVIVTQKCRLLLKVQLFGLVMIGLRQWSLKHSESGIMLSQRDVDKYYREFTALSSGLANYVNAFLKIADEETEFPEMRDWLDSDPEQVRRSDTERIWGVRDQTKFTMEDLKTWVERGGTLKAWRTSSPEEEEHSGKGKKKAQKSHKKLLNLVSVVLNFFDKCLVTLGYLALSIICTIFSLAMGFSHAFVTLPLFMKLVIIVAILPFVSASPTTQPFPDIPFRDFSAFVEQTFAPKYH